MIFLVIDLKISKETRPYKLGLVKQTQINSTYGLFTNFSIRIMEAKKNAFPRSNENSLSLQKVFKMRIHL